jgi:hypothetical protein
MEAVLNCHELDILFPDTDEENLAQLSQNFPTRALKEQWSVVLVQLMAYL